MSRDACVGIWLATALCVAAAPATARASSEAGLADLDRLAFVPLVAGLQVVLIVDIVYAFEAEPLPVPWIVTEALFGYMSIRVVSEVRSVDSDVQLAGALVGTALLLQALCNAAWSAEQSQTTSPCAKPRAKPRMNLALDRDRASVTLAADF